MSVSEEIVESLVRNKVEFVTTVPCKQLAGVIEGVEVVTGLIEGVDLIDDTEEGMGTNGTFPVSSIDASVEETSDGSVVNEPPR